MKPYVILSLLGTLVLSAAEAPKTEITSSGKVWPEPPVAAPLYDGKPVAAPAGAVILFDGKDFSAWIQLPPKEKPLQAAEPVLWKIQDGYMEITPRSGMIRTKEKVITSGHLHLEWATPAVVKGEGQGRGNSGVLIEGIPELQVLDSFNNKTYFDGQAAAFYKHRPPLVNVCREPGLWQSYDIHLQRAKLVDGKVTEPATVTVYHNNVLVQDRVHFSSPLQAGALRLQDHLNPGRFRNIWFAPVDKR
jgi:hypothetical protein